MRAPTPSTCSSCGSSRRSSWSCSRTASGGRTFDNFKIPNAESQTAADLLTSRFAQQSGTSATVVFQARSGTLATPANQAAIADSVERAPEAPARDAGRRAGRSARRHADVEERDDRARDDPVRRAPAGARDGRVPRARGRDRSGRAGRPQRAVRRPARRLRERQPHQPGRLHRSAGHGVHPGHRIRVLRRRRPADRDGTLRARASASPASRCSPRSSTSGPWPPTSGR